MKRRKAAISKDLEQDANDDDDDDDESLIEEGSGYPEHWETRTKDVADIISEICYLVIQYHTMGTIYAIMLAATR